MQIEYSIGRKEESFEIAKLIHEVAVISRYLYADLEPNKSALDLIHEDVSKDHSKNSYQNCLVARDGNKVIGVANFYHGKDFTITDSLVARFGSEKIKHISSLFEADLSDSLYISALITDGNYRGKEVGKNLIDRVKQKATDVGLPYVSLYVWVDNIHAIRFYERYGFKTAKHVNIEPTRNIVNQGGLLLLKY